MDESLTFSAIIPAAGSGSRSNRELPKQYIEIQGESILRHSIRAFALIEECIEIIIPIDTRWESVAKRSAVNFDNVRFVPGGKDRQHSIRNGLAAVHPASPLILVHDAARPAVSSELIRSIAKAAEKHGGAIPAIQVSDTLKRVDEEGGIIETIPRTNIYRAQTPQGFHSDLLRKAYRIAEEKGWNATDDASLVELIGERVVIVPGEERNIKVTMPEDFKKIEEILFS